MNLLKTVGFYVASAALDFASSIGGYEMNPFCRYPDGVFWPHRALLNAGASVVGVGVLSLAAYQAGKTLGKQWATFCASLPWLYFGWEHLHAALINLQIQAGLFMPAPH